MLISRKDCDIININQGHIPVSERVSDTVNTPERHNNNTGNRRRSPVPPRAPKGQPSDTRARSGAGRQPSPRPDTYSAARPVQRNPAPSDLQNNLKSQTPLNRRMRQKTAPAEPGTRRRATKPQYYRIKEEQERKKKRTVFGYRVLPSCDICRAYAGISSAFPALASAPHLAGDAELHVYRHVRKKRCVKTLVSVVNGAFRKRILP